MKLQIQRRWFSPDSQVEPEILDVILEQFKIAKPDLNRQKIHTCHSCGSGFLQRSYDKQFTVELREHLASAHNVIILSQRELRDVLTKG